MPNNEQFPDLRFKEDEFFYRRDRERLEESRRRAEAERQLLDLCVATSILDPEILRDLQRQEYNPQTVILLEVVPLVQVAWSDGSVNEQERERIYRIARLDGIEEHDPGWRRLAQCLETRPSDEFFRVTLRALRAWLAVLSAEVRGRIERKLLAHCTSVASVSGGFLGLNSKISGAERSAIGEIVAALERD